MLGHTRPPSKLLRLSDVMPTLPFQMYDRKLHAWMKVESLAQPDDLVRNPTISIYIYIFIYHHKQVLFIGEKVPLFSGSSRYPAAPHRLVYKLFPIILPHKHSL